MNVLVVCLVGAATVCVFIVSALLGWLDAMRDIEDEDARERARKAGL